MVRGGVGLLDITGFSRFEVTGPNAERWLNTLMASNCLHRGGQRWRPCWAMMAG